MSKQSNKSKQSLQKFTELRTKEDFIAFKESSKPEEFDSYKDYIRPLINKALEEDSPDKYHLERYFNCYQLWTEFRWVDYPQELVHFKQLRWQINKQRIEHAINMSLKMKNRLPTNNEIMAETGLSRTTIHKHIKEGTGSDYYKEELNSFKLLTGKVLGTLYRIGTEDRNVKALKVFLDYTGGAATTPTTIKQQNNYLQINNTRIDEVTVNSLPEEARLQIEGIIKQYQTV